MLKVLVADENLETNSDFCSFLANDKNLDVVSTRTGINTIDTYNKIKPNLLVINSDFKDKSYTDIVNELSSTSEGRNNCNIILTVEENTRLKFISMSKIYQVFYFSMENTHRDSYSEIKETIEQFNLDHYIFYEPSDTNLVALFYKFKVYNDLEGAEYLRYAIQQCYNNPSLKKDLNNIYRLVSDYYGVSFDSVRPAMRRVLVPANKAWRLNGNKGCFSLFEIEKSITPKNFIRIITDQYLKNKK